MNMKPHLLSQLFVRIDTMLNMIEIQRISIWEVHRWSFQQFLKLLCPRNPEQGK